MPKKSKDQAIEANEPLVISESQRQLLEKICEAKPRYSKRRQYREYYDGKHETMLTERQRKYLQIKTGQEFNDNYCPIVVDALAERLVVTGFTVSGESEEGNKK